MLRLFPAPPFRDSIFLPVPQELFHGSQNVKKRIPHHLKLAGTILLFVSALAKAQPAPPPGALPPIEKSSFAPRPFVHELP